MTVPCSKAGIWNNISTHILTKRMTDRPYLLERSYKNFNSHPHEEDDEIPSRLFRDHQIFQLTSSRRGWPQQNNNVDVEKVFQLTSSRRGWPICRVYKNTITDISPHILTKRMTRRLFHNQDILGRFQLTSSRRGWPHTGCNKRAERNISTHILTKRMTFSAFFIIFNISISTHILTKRMTLWRWWWSMGWSISTHILTKRMTVT